MNVAKATMWLCEMPAVSKRTPEVIEEILRRMSAGEPLANICRDEHMPHMSTWRVWCRDDDELNIAHAQARDDGFDVIAADALNIVDEQPEYATSEGGSRVDSGYVQWAKNRAEMRLKLLAKWDYKRYGDKMDLTSLDGSMSPPKEPSYKLVD